MKTQGFFQKALRLFRNNESCESQNKVSFYKTIIVLCYCLCFLAFLLFVVFIAKRGALYVPTYHMDGAFQTTSGLFRLQNGEVPGRDFFPYLGVLPIYLCYPIFLLIGGDVTASVFAAQFVVLFCCMFSFSIIHFFISKRRCFIYSLSCGSALTIFIYLININFPSVKSLLDFSSILFPGNSLRPIRQFAPYLCILPLYFLYKNVNKSSPLYFYLGALWISLFSLWSNDYGLGTVFVAFAGSSILILTSKTQRRYRCLLCFFSLLICGIVFFYELATLGNMKSLILYNFRDVAKDQYWYFEPLNESQKVYSLTSLGRMFVISSSDLILPCIASLILLIDSFFSKSFEKIYLLLIGCILFCGGLTASVGGHISDYFRYFFFWGVGVVFFYVFSLTSFLGFEKIRTMVSAFFLLIFAIYACASEMIHYQKDANSVNNSSYFFDESLGGYLSVEWKPYLTFLDENRNKSFLEEYWGVTSAYLHRNSDWKVDSVIHAFNKTRDDSSKKILNKDYIITSSDAYEWTFWNLAQNYWFYEYIFHNYDFLFSVYNSIYVWKKRETPRVFDEDNTCHLIDQESFQIESPGFYEIHLEYEYAPRFHSLLVLNFPLGKWYSLSLPPYQNQYSFWISCIEPKVFSLRSICNPGTFRIKSVLARKVPNDLSELYDSWKSFYLTDGNWERGYFKQSGGFFVKNTKENRELYVVDAFVLLPDGSQRKIIRIQNNMQYLNVFTEGDSFITDLFPHQLEVIQE